MTKLSSHCHLSSIFDEYTEDMKKQFTLFLAIAMGLTWSSLSWADPVSSLSEIVRLSIDNSFAFKAKQGAEKVAQSRSKVAETGYIPTVNFEAIDSSGFPASSGAMGITGLMGSPFRSGLAYGLTAKETLDFGRTRTAIEVADKELKSTQSDTAVEKWKVAKDVIQLYYACSQTQSLATLWTQVEKDSSTVQKEISGFIRSGQYSIADGMLVKVQTEEASRKRATYEQEVKLVRNQLAEYAGVPPEQIVCLPLNVDMDPHAVASSVSVSERNVFVEQAKAQKEIATSKVSEARSGYMPELMFVGSVGQMDQARLVEKSDSSLGVGLIFPLFDGLKTPREVDQALAYQMQKEAEVQAAQQAVDEANLKFDQILQSDEVALNQIQGELKDSDQAFKLSRQRYRDYSGTLVDVREALRNYSSIRSDFIRTVADQQQAASLKAVFNGQELK